jgi:hypothetical protein
MNASNSNVFDSMDYTWVVTSLLFGSALDSLEMFHCGNLDDRAFFRGLAANTSKIRLVVHARCIKSFSRFLGRTTALQCFHANWPLRSPRELAQLILAFRSNGSLIDAQIHVCSEGRATPLELDA